MHEFAERLLTSKRKGLFKSRPVFEPYESVTEISLVAVEQDLNTTRPEDLKNWLLLIGHGDVNEELSFRREWFKRVEYGALVGAVMFAQDILGNFYAYLPGSGEIVFFSRSDSEYACISPGFRDFVKELECRKYQTIEWMDSLLTSPYSWDA